jgi:DNA-binding NarL/FixJ family response regulator
VRSRVGAELMRIIVVDDHESVRKILAAILSAYGLEVIAVCANGREAVDIVRDLRPDAVVMDVRMPVLDGIAATRAIKGASPETRVVLLTAYEEDDLRTAALAAGADDFVLKGVSGNELAAVVRRHSPWEADVA